MQLKSIKLANSVRGTQGEYTYLTQDQFNMKLSGPIIRIEEIRSKNVVFTSLYNTIWFTAEEQNKEGKDESEQRQTNQETNEKPEKPAGKASKGKEST